MRTLRIARATGMLALLAGSSRDARAQGAPHRPSVADSALAARPGADAVALERRGPAELLVGAGGQFTLVYRVVNGDVVPRIASGSLRLPDGWSQVIPSRVDTVPARATFLTLLRVAVPADARAGAYGLRYTLATSAAARGRGGAAALAYDSVRVTVALRRELAVALREVPRFVVAGDRYTARFVVHNGGTAAETVRLRLRSSDDFAVRLEDGTASMRLEPAEQRTVVATVVTDASLVHALEHRVQLDAYVAGDSASPTSAVSRVEVVARQAASNSRFRRLPAELALRSSGAGRPVTGELRGGGLVTESAQLRFVARSPSVAGDAFGMQDEYWAEIAAPSLALRLGDQGFMASRLRETGHPAFGGAGELTVGRLRLGAFASRDRRSYLYTGEQQRGGTVGLALGARTGVESGLLSRTGVNGGRIWSTRGRVAALPGVSLSGEYGRGAGDSARGDAYVAALTAARGRVSLTARRESADSGFPGYWRGTTYSDAALAVSVPGRLELIGNANGYRMLGRQSTFTTSGSYQRGVEAGFAWAERRLGATWRHGWLGGGRSRLLTDVPGMIERRGSSVRLFAGLPVGSGRVSGDVELGHATTTDAPDARLPFSQFALRGGIGSPRLSLAGAVQQTNGPSPFSFGTVGQTSVSVDGGVRIVAGTRISVGMSAMRYGTPARTFSTLTLGVGQELPSGQRLGYQGRSFATSAGGAPLGGRLSMQQLEYVVPMGLPVGLATESGTIEARLTDDATGRPVPGVLVRIANERRLTDARGAARFTRLAAGTYYLTVDREGLGRDRIVSPSGAVRIELARGEQRDVALQAVGSAALQGAARVHRYQPTRLGAPDTLVDAGPLASVALLLTSGADTVRAVTDDQGRYSAPELRVGRWTVSVAPADLPARHMLAPSRVELDLASGEVRTLALRAIPVRPAVQFIDEADLTIRAARDAPVVRQAGRPTPRKAPRER